MKYIKTFEIVENPFRNHELRVDKKYRPYYKPGLIAVRFQDEEHMARYKRGTNIEDDTLLVDYQKEFDDIDSDFAKYFCKKYGLERVIGDDELEFAPINRYHTIFKVKPGEEEKKIKELSKLKIVKDVDFVDIREYKFRELLRCLIHNIEELRDEITEISDDERKKRVSEYIEELKKLL